MSDGFSSTDAMKKEALKGLAWRKEFNRGGTMVGVARARDIANGANLSLDTLKRMNSFFARHEVDKEAEGFRPGEKGFPSNGRIAWALWGGDAGKAWASTQLNLVQGAAMIFPEDEEFLAHFGVKGMKWGQRKGAMPGVSSKTNRAAKKDAKEFARAKMFYGEGAGTRRKLIKATVEAKSKKDPSYKKAFDSHLGNQDMASQASKARGERKRKDVATKTKQRVGYLARKATGEMGTQAAFTAVAIGGIAFAKSPKGQKIMKESALKVKQAANYSKNKKIFDQMMKNMG
jgi:hypothetical protein